MPRRVVRVRTGRIEPLEPLLGALSEGLPRLRVYLFGGGGPVRFALPRLGLDGYEELPSLHPSFELLADSTVPRIPAIIVAHRLSPVAFAAKRGTEGSQRLCSPTRPAMPVCSRRPRAGPPARRSRRGGGARGPRSCGRSPRSVPAAGRPRAGRWRPCRRYRSGA